MPYYEFVTLDESEYTTLFFVSSEVPSIGSTTTDSEGKEWRRVASYVNAARDTIVDPHSAKSFNKIMDGKKTDWGTMWDVSKEMSDRRTQMEGHDKIKNAFESKREDQLGIVSPEKQKAQAKEKLKKLGVTLKEKSKK